eukprot:Rhum_TRINITY_DN14261_c16_g1::Rhum_TRINITY_DN14261_c16_g1_i1::g.77695::m.77695
MSPFSRFGASFAAANGGLQGSFMRGCAMARGFATNPRAVAAPVIAWNKKRRAARDQIRQLRRDALRHELRDTSRRRAPTSFTEWWDDLCVGTELVWRPVYIPVRNKVWWPVRRVLARTYDRGVYAKRSVKDFFTKPPPQQQQQYQSHGRGATQAGPASSSTGLMVVVSNAGRIAARNTSALAVHLKEFMLDPNFKRREALYKLRQWEPKTDIGRSMAPMGLAVLFFLPIWGITFIMTSNQFMDRERKENEKKEMILQRASPAGLLGLPPVEKKERTEDDALLDLFTTRRW